MRKPQHLIVILVLSFGLSACAVQKEFDQKFGDQHFKTSVALIELHNSLSSAAAEQALVADSSVRGFLGQLRGLAAEAQR